jgi:hypothetical protein
MATSDVGRTKQNQSQHSKRVHRNNNNNNNRSNFNNHRVNHSGNYNNKRQQPTTIDNRYEDNEVDDLAVAAQYAFAVPTSFLPVPQVPQILGNAIDEDENEIDLDLSEPSDENPYSENGDDEKQDTPNIPTDPNSDETNGKDDDDAESDVDLVEQLAQMVGEDEDEEVDDDDEEQDTTTSNQKTIKIRNKPMTVNEIDAYQADLHEIHDLLQWNVSITTSDSTNLSHTTKQPAVQFGKETASKEYQIAGHIQHHMIDERTIVILSAQGGVLLKEGTTLFIQMHDVVTSSDRSETVDPTRTTETCNSTNSDIIQLGNILEIFGPVSQPLYSIRLPTRSRPDKGSSKTKEVHRKRDIQANISTENEVEDEKILVSKEIRPTTIPLLESTIRSGDSNETEDVDVVGTEQQQELTLSPSTDSVDEWANDGKYTKLLQKCNKLPVYYSNDPSSTNILDTDCVYRNSGRGCDASNIFDEEIDDVQDYSDDEQERVAKGNRKKSHIIDGNDTTEVRRDNRRLVGLSNHRNSNVPHQRLISRTNQPTSQIDQSRYAPMQNNGIPPPQYFHPQQFLYSSGYPVGGQVPVYPAYTNIHAPQNSPAVNPVPQGYYIPQPHLQQPWYYYNGAYQTVPPPPAHPPTSSTGFAQQNPRPPHSGPPETAYYDFS